MTLVSDIKLIRTDTVLHLTLAKRPRNVYLKNLTTPFFVPIALPLLYPILMGPAVL
jgi:hypothetical protein